MGSLDIGVKKMILKEKVSIRITMVDLLNTQRWQQRVQFANMDFTYRRKRESRVIRLQFGWSFGKSKYQVRERKTNEDANRIKVKS
ncbi:MAG: outer membrane beta-barrel protein [Ferruginibacter sp.]|nr:outer membrane beta-barrel protein [Ferruginibacter sp.]